MRESIAVFSCARILGVLALGAALLASGETALAARAASGNACGLEAYQNKIAETEKASKALQDEASRMGAVKDQPMLVRSGTEVAAVHEGALAALVVLNDETEVMGNDSQIRHYEEVIGAIDESTHLSARDLSHGFNDKNHVLSNTTRLINSYYKSSDPTYSMKEVARAIQGAVRSGQFCHSDGSLAVTGEFRDIIVHELRSETAVAARMAGKSTDAIRARTSVAAASRINSSGVTAIKSGAGSTAPARMRVADTKSGTGI